MDHLIDSIARWKPFTAVVVGDFMLDKLVYGDAERLSADAPVPVLQVRHTEHRPGGAANVCLDLAALKGRVHAMGVTGDDAASGELRRALAEGDVLATGLVGDAARPTTVKQNLIGLAQARHPQKMFRVDYESREPIPSSVAAGLIATFERTLPNADVVCIEDYGKGVCTPEVCRGVIDAARAFCKPVFVDPASGVDYRKYRGASALTPNRTEAESATGMTTGGSADTEHNAALARRLMEMCELEAVVLTLDRHGALLLERDAQPLSIPTCAREVYDVSGAGDMFLAGLAAGRANGFGWGDAVRLANAAAGLEVEVFGVVPIPLDRIHAWLLDRAGRDAGKVRTREQAAAFAGELRRAGRRIVFTNGCFDIVHAGHVTLLEKAAALGDFLVVGLNTDSSVRNLKGPERPVHSENDRARVLAALESVGMVVPFAEDTPIELIRAVRPDILVKGSDYPRERVVGYDFVESYGGRVELVDLVKGVSTTRTIERIRAQA